MRDQLSNKRVLVTGVTGQVGRALKEELAGNCELITAARSGGDVALDLTNTDQIKSVIDQVNPDIIINPAAYTQVDKAEDEPELASAVNAVAPGIIAELCKKNDMLLVHYSTDYVFNGKGSVPYKEDDPTDPINVYGQTKLDGERAIQSVDCNHLIFRTCWVYDAFGKNFPNAILDRARTMDTLKVVDDQIGTPTWAGFIASVTQQSLVVTIKEGVHQAGTDRVYHLRPEGTVNWYGFAKAIIDYAKQKEELQVKEIIPVNSKEFPTKAARPRWSVLDNQKLKRDFDLVNKQWPIYLDYCYSA